MQQRRPTVAEPIGEPEEVDDEDAPDEDAPADVQTVRLAILTGEGHPYMAGAEGFIEAIEELSEGRIEVDLFADAQLGGEADYLELVRTGSLEFGQFVMGIPASTLGESHLQALSLPFLYPDADAMYEVWYSDAVQDRLEVFREQHGFECIGLWDTDFRQLTSNTPIESVDDFNGLRIRVPEGALYVDTWEALGAVPTAMAIPELYSSLETGVVDATDIPFVAIITLNYYEVQDYASRIEYMDDPVCFAVSNTYMESLDDELQGIVREAGRRSNETARAAARQASEESVAELQELGMEFTEIDTDELRAAVEPVYENFFEREGDEARQFVEDMQAVMGQ